MQIQAKIGRILYYRGGKLDSNYPDLELNKEFWNRVWVPGSDYKSLGLTVTYQGVWETDVTHREWDPGVAPILGSSHQGLPLDPILGTSSLKITNRSFRSASSILSLESASCLISSVY